MDKVRVERKIRDLVDWDTVKYHTEMIEVYIGKLLHHQLDFTGDIRFELERLAEIFSEAEDRATDQLLEEDDRESDAIFLS